MKKYGVNELRKMFLDFMESKGHLVMKSFPLVPQGDKKCPADQCRNDTTETIFYRSRKATPKYKSQHLSEMYSYRRY